MRYSMIQNSEPSHWLLPRARNNFKSNANSERETKWKVIRKNVLCDITNARKVKIEEKIERWIF